MKQSIQTKPPAHKYGVKRQRGLLVFARKAVIFSWRRAPLSISQRIWIKNQILRRAGFIFKNTDTYATWKVSPSAQPSSPIKPYNIIKIDEKAAEQFIKELEFLDATEPLVSVIIPMFNKTKYTLECLTSICRNRPINTFEIIIVDDGSTEKASFSTVHNIRYVRCDENKGFIIACNIGASYANGKYLLFLNNDTQVFPGWLDELVKAFDVDADVGVVGSKIVYPSGYLQEAGALLRRDGLAELIGHGDDPSRPRYNFAREVDYCSGASLMIARELFRELNGFSEDYVPGYYEDSDLCFRVRKLGKKIVYQPTSVILHHLSITTANHPTGKEFLAEKNRNTFCKKWQSELDELNEVRLLAFYLPQFHPIPENDEWWGKGFTEWMNVVKGRPNFVGHYQPHLPADLGFYDLRVPEVREAQADLARKYGVSGFCYYYYWFGKNKKLLNRPMEDMLKSKSPNFPFCICWANENWTRRWDGMDSEVLIAQAYDDGWEVDFIEDVMPALRDRRYVRIDGRPLLLVYSCSELPDAERAASIWRERCRDAGIGEIYLAMVQNHRLGVRSYEPEMFGFNAAVEFPPHGLSAAANNSWSFINEDFTGSLWDYAKTASNFCNRPHATYKLFRGVMPSWDNTARQQDRGSIFINGDPDTYKDWLREAVDDARKFKCRQERIVFINAWNEWAEGAHLEPDQEFGHLYLEKTREALVMAGCLAPPKPTDHLRKHVRLRWQRKAHTMVEAQQRTQQSAHNIATKITDSLGGKVRIGIGLVEHFGDIVACEPVSRYLRKQHPDASIAWVVREQYKELLEHNPAIDEVIIVSCLTDWIKVIRHKTFNKVVDLHVNKRVCPECNIVLVKSEGNVAVDVDNYYSYGSLLGAFCRGAGIYPIDDSPRVYIPRAIERKVALLRLPERYVVFHCVSNEQARNWLPEKWMELARFVSGELGYEVIEVGHITTVEGPAVKSLCGRLSLLETAEVIKGATLFVGIDSGPAHMANAVGVAGVILLGRYRKFKKYMPFTGRYAKGDGATVIHNLRGPASELAVDVVKAAVLQQLRRV